MVIEIFMDIFNDGQEAVNGRIVGFEPELSSVKRLFSTKNG